MLLAPGSQASQGPVWHMICLEVVGSAQGLSGLSRNPTGGAKGKHSGLAPCFVPTQSGDNSFYSLFTDNLYLCGTSATVKTIWGLLVNQIYLEEGNFSPAFNAPDCPITALNLSCDRVEGLEAIPSSISRKLHSTEQDGCFQSLQFKKWFLCHWELHRDAFGNVLFPLCLGLKGRRLWLSEWTLRWDILHFLNEPIKWLIKGVRTSLRRERHTEITDCTEIFLGHTKQPICYKS